GTTAPGPSRSSPPGAKPFLAPRGQAVPRPPGLAASSLPPSSVVSQCPSAPLCTKGRDGEGGGGLWPRRRDASFVAAGTPASAARGPAICGGGPGPEHGRRRPVSSAETGRAGEPGRVATRTGGLDAEAADGGLEIRLIQLAQRLAVELRLRSLVLLH